jgi:hypothetical protein
MLCEGSQLRFPRDAIVGSADPGSTPVRGPASTALATGIIQDQSEA